MWQFVLAIEGLKDACEALNVPIVSGNVSLYNETNDLSIYPTPMIGMVGLIEDADRAVTQWNGVSEGLAPSGAGFAAFAESGN